jgi:hypothetical protein
MLFPVGEQVILVEVEGAGDYANASTVLDAETMKVLAKGHNFNSESRVPYLKDVNGKIAVPPEVLQIDASDASRSVVQRGAFLYDKDARSDVFAADLEVDVVLSFPFESCPFHIQRLIVAQAAKAYQRAYVGSAMLDSFAQDERLEAGADSGDAESDSDDYNILNNPDLWYLRRQTYRTGI